LYTICQPVGDPDSDPLPARVANISTRGINLLLKRPVESGVMMTVLLPGHDEGQESCFLVYVNNVRLTDEGEWSLGCTFALELDDETLGVFGSHGHRPAAPDQRQWDRNPCSTSVRFHTVGPIQVRGSGNVVDLTPAGIGLIVDQPLTIGALLNLEIENPGHNLLLTILASVVRMTSQQGRKWRIGCTFVRELLEEELQRIV
jgi:hypothetical protein